jgi:hypothetical protein
MYFFALTFVGLLLARAPPVGARVLLNGGEVLVAHHVEEGGPRGGDGGLAVPSRQLSLQHKCKHKNPHVLK